MVYPPGFEPGLDGVGGRNVIQLHYEYLFAAYGGKRLLNNFSAELTSRQPERFVADKLKVSPYPPRALYPCLCPYPYLFLYRFPSLPLARSRLLLPATRVLR